MSWEYRNAEVRNYNFVNEYAQQRPKGTHERIPGGRHGMLSVACPRIPWKPQYLNGQPSQQSGDRNGKQDREPLPQGKSQKLVTNQKAGKMSLDLVYRDLLVQFRKPGQRVGR